MMNSPGSPPQDSIPSAITVSSEKGSADLLLKLIEACAKHKRYHESTSHDGAANDENMDDKCHQDLTSLAGILPRVEGNIVVDDTRWDSYRIVGGGVAAASSNGNSSPKKMGQETKISNNGDVLHLCALYRAIIRSSFCPHAAKFIFGSDEILPRVVRLLGYLIKDPAGASTREMVEDIGNAVAELLCLLDNKTQTQAIQDLICLANDLNTIDEAGVLFNPDDGGSEQRAAGINGGECKIRIKIFEQLCQDTKIGIPSRRSLLSLQLGVWIILKRLVPKQDYKYGYVGRLSGETYGDRTGIMNEVIAASKPILLAKGRNDAICGWMYADEDARVHSMLLLRTKLMIIDLLRSIIRPGKSYSVGGDLFRARNVDPQHINLSLLAVEAAKVHLIWNQSCESLDGSGLRLSLQFSRSTSHMLSAMLTSGPCIQVLPYLVDLIPHLVSQRESCLSRVILRILHIHMLQNSHALVLIHRRSLAHGYYMHLFQLTADSSEHVSCVAVAVVTLLLRNTCNRSDLNRCLEGIVLSNGSNNLAGQEEQQSVQEGNKRRRLADNIVDIPAHNYQGESVHSALTHFILASMAAADSVGTSIDNRSRNGSPKQSLKVKPPIASRDLPNIRIVAGMFRILTLLRSIMASEVLEEAVRRLCVCIQNVARMLSSHEQEGINLMELSVLRQSVSLVVGIGFHIYQAEKYHCQTPEKESLSHCIMTVLPLLSDDSVEIDEESLELQAPIQENGCCRNACNRLCSVIGVKIQSPSDVCLCGLGLDSSDSANCFESGMFLVNDVMPLKFRCILLAALSPITADSSQNDTTLTSFQRILADTSRTPDEVTAALITLPTLLLSLAACKQDQDTSMKYILSLMESFDFELVSRHCQSGVRSIRVASFLSLARLNEIYTSASTLNATSFWSAFDPMICGVDSILKDMLHFKESSDELAHGNVELPPSLSAPNLSDNCKLQLLRHAPYEFLSAHLYLRSALLTLSISTLESFGGSSFLSNRKHYAYFDAVASAVDQNSGCSEDISRIPLPVWVLLAPFFAPEPSARQVAASVGSVLLSNHCKVLNVLFTEAGKVKKDDDKSKSGACRVVEKLFREIEYLLHRFFRLPREIISLAETKDVHEEEEFDETGLDIAAHLLKSLCQVAPLDSDVGLQVFQQSVLRLIRIWVAGTSTKYSVDAIYACSFSLASDAIKQVFRDRERYKNVLNDDTFAASVFREFFLPAIKDSSPWSRYQLLVEFCEACLMPISSSNGQPGVDVPNCFEVGRIFEEFCPSIITSMILDEDIQGLEMCAAFRLYMVQELKTQEKRQKKSGDEFIVGKQPKSRPASFARDLVPGVKLSGRVVVSAKALTDNMKMLCWKSHVIEHVLPKLLLHSNRAALKFFTELCPPNTSLSQILREKEQTVLKTLVWELGVDDPREDMKNELYGSQPSEQSRSRKSVVLALKMGHLIKEGHLASPDVEDDISSAKLWIGPNFLYLLVNVVLYRWQSRNERERFHTIKCLKELMRFLPSEDSLKFMPQIMVAISNAIGASTVLENNRASRLRFLAVSALFDFLKVLVAHQVSNVEEHLTSIVVILFPLFDDKVECGDIARMEAVNVLLWLAKRASLSFSEIPFLPLTPDLQTVRDALAEKNVFIDDCRLVSQADNDNTAANDELQSRFYAQMNILSDLIATHESKAVRLVVIKHMTKLIRSNRDLFTHLVENESLASMQFLTVPHEEGVASDNEASINGGFVTKLMMRLLSRCVDESDRDIRDALAICLGEIGALDSNRLGKEITSYQFSIENDDGDDWRLNQPPWKSSIDQYQLHLVTRILVRCLKSASSIIDQHKIGFGIQELLKQVNSIFISGQPSEVAPLNDSQTQSQMSPWLKDRLKEAEVQCIVEPFWTSDYQQQDIKTATVPPYFSRSNSYFRWLSSLSRFLVTRSHANDNSLWKDMFHGCRSAIRSQAGIDVAEFILPILVLDVVCFGETDDQNTVINEFLSALSFERDDLSMQPREREKAVNVILSAVDLIRLWTERGIEQMSSPKKSSRKSRKDSGTWPIEESISKINHFLKRIPLSVCAQAASAVGMNARALRFLEIESRSRCGVRVAMPAQAMQGPKHLKLQHIDGIDLDVMQVLLGKLNDFDTMVAISQRNRHHKSSLAKQLAEEATERELYGDIEGSCQAYEQLLDTRLTEDATDNRIEARQGLLRCLLKLGKLESVLNQSYGMSSKNVDNKTGISGDFLPSAAEAAWRLGDWSVLEQASDIDLKTIADPNDRHQLCLGRVMHAIQVESASKFESAIQEARESVMTSLTSAARDSYAQCYPHLIQLHALQEVEHASPGLLANAKNSHILCDEWTSRLNLASPDSTGSNAIVNTRLALCRMMNEPIAEGSLWLDIGKGARKVGLFQVAEKCLTHADVAFCSSGDKAQPLAQEYIGKVKLQFAKLKYALGETMSALNLIEHDMEMPSSLFHSSDNELESFISRSGQSADIIGRHLLQATEWMVADGLKSGSEIRNRYNTVLNLVPKWERAHFHYGKWLDMLYESSITKYAGQSVPGVDNNASRANAISNDEKCQQLLIDAINQYALALHLGQKHVYQALPRLLAMWTEFTAVSEDDQSAALTKHQSEANRLIKRFVPKIPEHLFYTALPQLVSHVLHENKDTSRIVIQILTSVLSKYPCQTLWSCNWLRFSKSDAKQKAGNDIFNGAKKVLLKLKGGKELQSMLDGSKELYKFLMKLAKYTSTSAASLKMKCPKFAAPLRTFIPPIQSALSVTPGALDRSDVDEVFPQFVPRMRAFNPEVKIMQSKAKPKRISAFAIPATANLKEKEEENSSQDIGEMHFLIKQEAKGDLRKDSRVQDLNNVINRLLTSRKASSGSDSRRKRLRLHLRTFSVVCLSEDCGVLEWVPNTDSFRGIIGGTYNPQEPPKSDYRHGTRITNYNNVKLRDAFMKCQDMYFKRGDLIGAAQKFYEMLQDYRPFMYWWFVQNFPNPHAWYEARNNFTLSTAVWSAVGHVMGLGDRHSENILIDTKSGECVHVDFDCIFDKGLLLPRPEVIPFRLTPNMIDAFGPTGADGLYTGALIESMRTLRQNKDILLSVLEPFLKDPVINFSSSKNQQKAQTASAKAIDAIRKIDGRLNGMYNLTNPNYKKVIRRDGGPQEQDDSASNIALSVEGQVQKMIAEATSHENLVQVYVGWMPWI